MYILFLIQAINVSYLFRLIPHKDFAIMTTPHLVPEFPLLQQFVRITPKPGVNVPHELYAFHRHGLLSSKFRVRKACSSDFEQVCCCDVSFSFCLRKLDAHSLRFLSRFAHFFHAFLYEDFHPLDYSYYAS